MQPHNESSKLRPNGAASRSSRAESTLETPALLKKSPARVSAVRNSGLDLFSCHHLRVSSSSVGAGKSRIGLRRYRAHRNRRWIRFFAHSLLSHFLPVSLILLSPASPACRTSQLLFQRPLPPRPSPLPLSFPPKSSIAFSPISTSLARNTGRRGSGSSAIAILATCRS